MKNANLILYSSIHQIRKSSAILRFYAIVSNSHFLFAKSHFKISEHPAVSDSSGTDHSASIIHFVGPLFERVVNDLGYFRNKFYSFLNSSDVWVEDDSDPDVNLDED